MDEPANPSLTQVRTPDLEPFFNVGIPDPVKFIDVVVREAITLGASDIFFEPQPEQLRVRVRIDGVLHELGRINLDAYGQISSRIKVMAALDPTEKRKVQEGQITIDNQGSTVNLRVEVVQTVNGELVVIRIHESKTIIMQLSQLGFNKAAYDSYMNILKQRSGLVLVCGPTGCGKTTTLYSTIMKLNENRSFNVMTIEDPVEFLLEDVNQMQVQKDIGFTFAQGLKTILRLSPDIVLVGEIRDNETAEIAVESGLTGQLVLSTLHAEDAVGALFRILDLEIETYLLNSSLAGVVAQRLVRRVCLSCKTNYQPTSDEIELFKKYVGRVPKVLVKGQGCGECGFLGYKGRMGIYEVLPITPEIRGMLRDRANETELRDAMVKKGFITLLRDGLEKSEAGFTTIPEVLRNSLRIA